LHNVKWLSIAFNVCAVITLIFLYIDAQKPVIKSDCTVKIEAITAKLYNHELKLDRMHQILKIKTYNDLLNQRRKIK